ncbi:AlbA family DNA-binding domain-containing protein [Ahrensia kielensis]|uniref:AlbA family DNA-binding domain-containing protein n=1 Tax=Ahrensia kielensis TaxID=76980 RepID=UPI0003753817|nr:ATP-binding protein [Ahrensia kielensis]
MARSITDEEIGYIKAMLARGKRNVDIQFYFNRQDRPVNSGRISQIRTGSYGPEVAQATDQDLDTFLHNFEAAAVGVPVKEEDAGPPTIAERAKSLFEQLADGSWKLRDEETSQQECKETFNPKKMTPIIKAIAALANNKGGFVFIGVENAGCKVVGLPDDTFQNTDIVQVSQKVKTFLTPTPDFIKATIVIGGMNVGVIYVEKYAEPPIIVSRDGDGLESGAILFRSPGQTAKISAGDLLILLRQRDQASQSRLLRSAQRVADIGLQNSLIVDTREGTIEADDTKVMIDRDLADQLEFIREGDFEEVEGAPTLRLIGDVRAIEPDGQIRERIENRVLTADTVLQAFLAQEQVRSPIEFVRESALVQRQWLPIFYFISLTNTSLEDAIVILSQTEAVYANSKANALERLRGQRSAFIQASGQAAPIVQKIQQREIDDLEDTNEDPAIARAIAGLPTDFEHIQDALDLLQRMFARAEGNSSLKGAIFKAAARLDEIAFLPRFAD